MRLVLYEWCCSGGLHSPESSVLLKENTAKSLLAEGRMMLESLAQDANCMQGCEVVVLVDDDLPATVSPRLPSACRQQPVEAGAEIPCLLQHGATADMLIVVAPETAGILVNRLNQLEKASLGPRLACGSARFAAAASDKQMTCNLLASGGVPVPAGCSLASGASLPSGFHLPAVQKARASAGGDGICLLQTAADFQPATIPTRIEARVFGLPVSVSCLCGPNGIVPLLPLEQRFENGLGTTYIGGQPAPATLRMRATRLAIRSIETMVRSTRSFIRSWVGVDMILGSRTDGREDRVLEVNPRLTTSFIGLTRGYEGGLVKPLIASAIGQPVSLGPCDEFACHFRLPR